MLRVTVSTKEHSVDVRVYRCFTGSWVWVMVAFHLVQRCYWEQNLFFFEREWLVSIRAPLGFGTEASDCQKTCENHMATGWIRVFPVSVLALL